MASRAISCALLIAILLAPTAASRAAIAGIAALIALLVFSNPRVVLVVSTLALAVLFAGGQVSPDWVPRLAGGGHNGQQVCREAWSAISSSRLEPYAHV